MTNRFTKLDNGYVHDALLNVEWHPVSIAVDNWQEAQDKAAALGDGWRCPTVDELCTLPDRTKCNPAIDTTYFPDTHSGWYWSSSPVVELSARAWSVGFYYGYVYGHPRNGSGFVRPVRAAKAAKGKRQKEVSKVDRSFDEWLNEQPVDFRRATDRRARELFEELAPGESIVTPEGDAYRRGYEAAREQAVRNCEQFNLAACDACAAAIRGMGA
jgi:hypothetical protein